MDDRTRNEGDPEPDAATQRMEPPALPGYGQPPPPPAPPMSTGPIAPPVAGTPGWSGPVSAPPVSAPPVSAAPAWTQPGAPATAYPVPEAGVTSLAKAGALVLILFGLFWALIGAALLILGNALRDLNVPELQDTIVINGEVISYVELAVRVAAGIGIFILVLAILEVLVGIFAWRGSGFARFVGTLYALIFGIPMLLFALGGAGSRGLDGTTTNTTGGVLFVLIFAIGYLFAAFAFIFRWRSNPAR